MHRATSIKLFSLAIMAMMWGLSVALFALTVDIMYIKQRRIPTPVFAGAVR